MRQFWNKLQFILIQTYYISKSRTPKIAIVITMVYKNNQWTIFWMVIIIIIIIIIIIVGINEPSKTIGPWAMPEDVG